ncbi:uncharacterized protein TNCV_1894601 [Trichonephila clavipes]|nr:uncharacterized protein TNCV_1894601 [Trichonephila clavipes]
MPLKIHRIEGMLLVKASMDQCSYRGHGVVAYRRVFKLSLDSRSSNSKLWKLVKGISKEQPQCEKCNTIQSTEELLAQNDEQTANILRERYQLISSLNLTSNDKYVKNVASNVVQGCRSRVLVLLPNAALNDSWRLSRLPRDWKKAIMAPIRKPGKNIASARSLRPIALTYITLRYFTPLAISYMYQHSLFRGSLTGYKGSDPRSDQNGVSSRSFVTVNEFPIFQKHRCNSFAETQPFESLEKISSLATR